MSGWTAYIMEAFLLLQEVLCFNWSVFFRAGLYCGMPFGYLGQSIHGTAFLGLTPRRLSNLCLLNCICSAGVKYCPTRIRKDRLGNIWPFSKREVLQH